jgi:hypothetical protein
MMALSGREDSFLYRGKDSRNKLAEFLRDHLLSSRDSYFELTKQLDNIAVWLVGISTGSIALIVSQMGKFNLGLHLALKITVICLSLTIILALLFRVFHLFLQIKERDDFFGLIGFLSGSSEPSTVVPDKLPDGLSAKVIAECIYFYMGQDLRGDLSYNQDVELWRNRYQEHVQIHKEFEKLDSESQQSFTKDFYTFIANSEGIPVESIEKTVKGDDISRGIRKRRLRRCCQIFYVLMCFTFAVSVLIISYSFMKTDFKTNSSATSTNQKTVAPSKQAQPDQTIKVDESNQQP